MSEDDVETIGPDATGPLVPADRDRRAPRFSWTPAYEATFFRSLCESVQLGLREHNSFKAEAWERASAALQATHGAYPTKNHLINKSDNARKRFRLWRGLREDPAFLYNPATKIVTATEEAWAAHIEKEPLSRALRGRPFEHEDYMEILYPDVVGSGGAPKRIMRPRRKNGVILDSDMPGMSIIDLQEPTRPTIVSSSPRQQPSRPSLSQTPTGSSSTGSIITRSITTQQHHPQITRSATFTPAQITAAAHSSAQIAAAAHSSALTPPEETATQSQSQARKHGPVATTPQTEPTLPPSLGDAPPAPMTSPPQKRRRTSYRGTPLTASAPAPTSPVLPGQSREAPPASSSSFQAPLIEEILEALRSRAAPRWREQALDLFFRDFSGEELDLQVKISENVLSNENKAMVFCKMPERVRQHWVGKFREMHQLNKTT